MQTNTKIKAAVAIAGCTAAGAAAGLAGAAASPSTKSPRQTLPALPGRSGMRWHFRERGMGVGPAVHEQAVVLNKAGTGFITATEDRGTVQSVSGDRLTIKEGVGNVTYRTVTLTIPKGATIERNFAGSALTALRSGDRVRVVQSSEGTDVFAVAPGQGPFGRGRHWDGPRPGAVPPPAAAPGAAAAPGPPGGPATY